MCWISSLNRFTLFIFRVLFLFFFFFCWVTGWNVLTWINWMITSIWRGNSTILFSSNDSWLFLSRFIYFFCSYLLMISVEFFGWEIIRCWNVVDWRFVRWLAVVQTRINNLFDLDNLLRFLNYETRGSHFVHKKTGKTHLSIFLFSFLFLLLLLFFFFVIELVKLPPRAAIVHASFQFLRWSIFTCCGFPLLITRNDCDCIHLLQIQSGSLMENSNRLTERPRFFQVSFGIWPSFALMLPKTSS